MSRSRSDWRMAGKHLYKEWCQEHPEISISYTEFQNVIYTFNEGFRDHLLETGLKGKLPWGFGDFVVSKKKPLTKKKLKDGKEIIALPIDWKKTREKGMKIYHLNTHTEGYKFRFKWMIKTRRFKYSEVWTFKPSRISSRLIRHYINQGYQHKYYEWDGIPNI